MQHAARPGSVVVFVDASQQSLQALDAAAKLAQSMRAPLHLAINAADDRGHRLTDRAINRIQLRDRMIQLSVDFIAIDDLSGFTKACDKARVLVAPARAATDSVLTSVLESVPCTVTWIGESDTSAQAGEPGAAQPPAGRSSTAPAASKRNATSKAASRQAS